jgi:hypothetical protein
LIVGGLERERKIAGRDVFGEIPVAGIYDDPDSDGRDQQFMDLQTFFRPNSFQQDKTHPQLPHELKIEYHVFLPTLLPS